MSAKPMAQGTITWLPKMHPPRMKPKRQGHKPAKFLPLGTAGQSPFPAVCAAQAGPWTQVIYPLV